MYQDQEPPGREPATVVYTYHLNDEAVIQVHTDPSGLWHAGVSATVWDASLILSKHFEKLLGSAPGPVKFAKEPKLELLSTNPLNVLELGAGCSALPSLVIAHYLAKSAPDHREGRATRHLVASDRPSALPLLKKSIESQTVRYPVSVRSLDWTNVMERGFHHPWNLIIASDLLAFPELYDSLVDTLISAANPQTIIYIAYERRDFAKEVEFFRTLGARFKFEMVPEGELDAVWTAPGEIYLYRAMLRGESHG